MYLVSVENIIALTFTVWHNKKLIYCLKKAMPKWKNPSAFEIEAATTSIWDYEPLLLH